MSMHHEWSKAHPDSPDPDHDYTTLNERRRNLGYPPLEGGWKRRKPSLAEWLFRVLVAAIVIGCLASLIHALIP